MWYCFIVGDVVREYWVFYLEDIETDNVVGAHATEGRHLLNLGGTVGGS